MSEIKILTDSYTMSITDHSCSLQVLLQSISFFSFCYELTRLPNGKFNTADIKVYIYIAQTNHYNIFDSQCIPKKYIYPSISNFFCHMLILLLGFFRLLVRLCHHANFFVDIRSFFSQ